MLFDFCPLSRPRVALILAFLCLPLTAGRLLAGELAVGTAAPYALELSAASAPAVRRTAAVDYRLQVGDILIGRTAPLSVNVRVTLLGAEWDGVPTVSVGANQAAGGAAIVGTPLVAGSLLVFVVQPPASAAGGFRAYSIPGDELFRIGPNARIREATALRSAGPPGVRIAAEFRDVRTGQLLQTGDPVTFVRSEPGATVSFSSGGTFTADIGATPVLSRFVNLPVNAGFIASDLVQLGTVRVEASGTAEGTTLAANVDATTGAFVFDTNPAAGADSLAISVTVPNASAVAANGLFLAGSASCGPPFSVLERSGDLFSGRVPIPAGGETAYTWPICLRATGASEIARQTVSATASVDMFDDRALDPAQVQARSLATIRSNGSEASVSFFNPAGNASQESMLRIVNDADRGGLVRVSGTCDDGSASSTIVAFNLARGNAVQLSAAELEAGSTKTEGTRLTFPPSCSGKRRLLITANFAPMSVVNLVRNQGSGGTVLTEIRGTP
jgi:hypothetical protein